MKYSFDQLLSGFSRQFPSPDKSAVAYYGLISAVLAGVYAISAMASLHLAFEQSNTSPVWPPTGIAIAALLIFGWRCFPGVFLGAFVTNFSTQLPGVVSLSIGVGNTLEALVAWLMITRFIPQHIFHNGKTVFIFALLAGIACAVGSSWGVTSLFIGGQISAEVYRDLWVTWWLGDYVGALVIAPLLIVWRAADKEISSPWLAECWVFSVCSLAVLIAMFSPLTDFASSHTPVAYSLVLLAMWCAYRFHLHGATLFTFVASSFAIAGTIQGYGPFVLDSVNSSLLLIQSFMGMLIVSSMVLGVSAREKRKMTRCLTEHGQVLEETILERVKEVDDARLQLEGEVQERTQTIDALQSLLSVSSLTSQSDLLRLCLNNLADIYQVNYALVGVYSDRSKTDIKTLSVLANGEFIDNFSYALDGTPCSDALDLEMMLVSEGAVSAYPRDKILMDLGVESYFGAPLISPEGEKIGILCVMDSSPMTIKHWTRSILTLYASRIATELERQRRDEEKALAETVFESSAQSIVISDANHVIQRVNPMLENMTGYHAEQLVGQSLSILFSASYNDDFFRSFWCNVTHQQCWQGEVAFSKPDGSIYPVWQTIACVRNDADSSVNHFVCIFTDISDKKASEEHIYRLAHYDTLTGLHNRSAFQSQLELSILQAQRTDGELALIYLDLDHFKLINDASGHATGDELLKIVANRLKQAVRKDDVVARLGGDEFVILLTSCKMAEDLAHIAKKILEELTQPIVLDRTECVVSASLGISKYPEDGGDHEALMQNADAAMYRAKQKGRNSYQFFTQEMNALAKRRLSIENALRKGLENNEFVLHYQPRIDARNMKITGCEALIRWHQPDVGLTYPGDFISIAEESGLIRPLGQWVIEEACRQIRAWNDLDLFDVNVSVNLSSRQFHSNELTDIIGNAIESNKICSEFLELELTESVIMENVDEAIKTFKALKSMGLSLSIDDFGTGYSSLSYLKKFPIDKLKIDRSFVRDIAFDSDDAAIVRATIALAHKLQLAVIAEGVETQQQLDYLRENKCYEVQGFYFSKPVPAENMTDLLLQGFLAPSVAVSGAR